MRIVYFVIIAAVVAGIAMMPSAIGTSLDQPTFTGHMCPGKETAPLDIAVSIPQQQIIPGASVMARVVVTARDYAYDPQVQVLSYGGANAGDLPVAAPPSLSPGESFEFDLLVDYSDAVNSGFEIAVTASDPLGKEFGRREGFYTVYRDGLAYHGRAGLLRLEHRAVRDQLEQGLITQEQYDAEMAVQLRPEGLHSETPLLAPQSSFAVGAGIAKLEPAMVQGDDPLLTTTIEAGGNITVKGTILFTDRNGTTHGAFGVQVEVWDDDLIFDDLLALDVVGSDGYYEFNFANDNGGLENGYDIYVKFRTVNEAIDVEDGGTYDNQSGVTNNVSDGSVLTRNFTYANSGNGAAGSVHVGMSYIAAFVKNVLNGGTALSQISVEWPGSGSFYDGSLHIEQGDRFDWDTQHHEYGHYVMDAFNFENNPGGAHSSASCATDVRPSKSEGLRLAWGESWPTYFGCSAQTELGLGSLGIPFVGDTDYDDTEEQNLNYDLEDESGDNLVGEGNERANMRVFWDLWDAPSDGPDNSNYTAKQLFDVVNAGDPTITSSAWADLRGSSLVNTNQLELAVGALSSVHGWGPTLVSPTAGSTVSPSSKTFNWNNGVNCGTFDGNQWDLVFYNPATFAKILTIPGLNSSTRVLTNGELTTLITGSNNHQVLWAVEGYNTSSPATGPYLGENFAITVNTPPVADAGNDTTVECTSHTTTTVILDGSNSYDPDGDAITYAWSPAGLFDNPNVANPTGHFTLGTTNVTLTVSDGIDSDNDQVVVTIEDTTPPEMSCPDPITIECASHCGTPYDDEQLDAFWAAFSATDVCDADPDTSFTHPLCFPLGTSAVIFEAEDESGNANACTTTVTVEDTTPPEINVVLDRDAMWPPNHKLVEVCIETIEVTDICDPNPTWVLTSIQSSEPDNGLGDGDTANDVQQADTGTDDACFLLRSERRGVGDGRKYTVIYTAMDMSGNTASDTSCVYVPHDQSGNALASLGFNNYGTSIVPRAQFYVVVIPSQPVDGYDATAIDASRAIVGNLSGAVKPQASAAVDVNGDGAKDLALYYSVSATEEFYNMSAASATRIHTTNGGNGAIQPLGLHYWDEDGTGRLIEDVFALGSPVAMPEPEAPERDGGVVVAEREFAPTQYEPRPALTIEAPAKTELNSVYPNPFNPVTNVAFTLETAENVSIKIYDVHGRLVRTIRNEQMPAGEHRVEWNGRNDAGVGMATGIYFLSFQAGDYRTTQKLVLLK